MSSMVCAGASTSSTFECTGCDALCSWLVPPSLFE